MGRAVPASLRVFRRQIASPAASVIAPGTPVVTGHGRFVGTVRGTLVELETGRASYAVSEDTTSARVILLPLSVVARRSETAVVDERVVERLGRRTA